MIQYILTDIEGTTTSVSFVFDTLFPYFIEHIDKVKAQIDQPQVQAQLALAKATVLEEEGKAISDEEAVDYLLHWTKTDRKHPALKAMQGIIWKEGYLNGELKGHVYEEVPACLRAWKEAGLQLGIYSSGSVPAQKLLFGYSMFGDLTHLFSNYFDTAVGHKRELKSYQNIIQELAIPAASILFLSDIEAELDAAKEAGMQTLQLLRPGTSSEHRHATVPDFKSIDLEAFVS